MQTRPAWTHFFGKSPQSLKATIGGLKNQRRAIAEKDSQNPKALWMRMRLIWNLVTPY